MPYFAGFDFDLDEVWAPLNPHLRGFRTEASTSSSASSSDNSIHGRILPPMQSSSVLGEPDSRVQTARLSGRGNQTQHEVSVRSQYVSTRETYYIVVNVVSVGKTLVE